MRSVKEFEATLVERLRASDPRGSFASEGDLERRFVLPLVRDILNEDSGPRVCAHPWNQPEKCEPNCTEGRVLLSKRKSMVVRIVGTRAKNGLPFACMVSIALTLS